MDFLFGTVKNRRRRRILVLVTAAMFADAVFFALITPLLPDYRDELSLSQLQVGLLFAAHPIGTVICAPLAARLVGRFGARMTMTVGLIALGAGTIVFGFAASLALLALCRFVQGGSAALVWCGGLARLRDVAPPERRGAALGLAGSAAGAGALFGPALAALTLVFSIEATLLVLGILTLVLCAALHSSGELEDEQHGAGEEPAGPLAAGPRYGLARPLGVIVVCGTVFGAVAALAPLRLDDLGASIAAISVLFALAAAGEAVASPFAGHLSDRVGRMSPIRGCLLLAMPMLALQALTGSAWVLGATVVLCGAAIASLWPLGTALLADESGDRSRSPAGVFAASVVAWSSGLAGGSLLAAALAQEAGDAVAYGALIAACAASLISLAGVGRGAEPALEG